MRILDRLLFFAYIRAYLIVLVSLLSLYVIIDLFTNIEDFAQHVHGLGNVLLYIARYYGYRVLQYFDRLCEAITLLAAMFTVAWMQRSNELLPLLSSGVPTRRAIRPVLIGACLMLTLGVLNQEMAIPKVADALLADRDDPAGDKMLPVQGAFEPNGVHIEGARGSRRTGVVQPFYVTLPESMTGSLWHLNAASAYYVPPEDTGPFRGGWLMTGTVPTTLDPCPSVLEPIDPGKFFLRVQEVDFDAVTRKSNWYMFASTVRLQEMLYRPDGKRQPAIAVLFHQRLTRPLLGFLLVVMGLSLILRDTNRNVFIGTALCLIMCGLFFAAVFASKQLGDSEYLSPALAAWMPVLLFGPLAFAMFDAIHT
ncbi:MAG: LptF/LptG family permease [Gemmataceae bacterium]